MRTVVLDQFYQIVETDSRHVPLFWKVVHIGLFVSAAACGLFTAWAFSQVSEAFSDNCILYAHLKFSNSSELGFAFPKDATTTEKPNGTATSSPFVIDQALTEWGPKNYCSFAHFTPIVSFIISVIFGTFFLVVGRGGGGYESDLFSNPWQIVVPGMVISFLFFFIILASSIILGDGLERFCNEFKDHLHNEGCVPAIDKYTTYFNEKNQQIRFYVFEQMAANTSYLSVLLWLLQFIILTLRLCSIADFDVYLTSIVQKEEEVLENVIEFHDDQESSDPSLEDVTQV